MRKEYFMKLFKKRWHTHYEINIYRHGKLIHQVFERNKMDAIDTAPLVKKHYKGTSYKIKKRNYWY